MIEKNMTIESADTDNEGAVKTYELPEEYSYLKGQYAIGDIEFNVSSFGRAKEMGDVPERLRHIRHIVRFTNEKKSTRFAKKLVSAGYIDVNVMKYIGESIWCIEFFRFDVASLPRLLHWDSKLKKLGESSGGYYCGYEFPAMAPEYPDETSRPRSKRPVWSLVMRQPQ